MCIYASRGKVIKNRLPQGLRQRRRVVLHPSAACPTRIPERCSMNDGPIAFRLGLRGMKATAEASIVERDVQLAQQFAGARLHVAHVSTADTLKAVRRGKRTKARVTCEVTPHHFTLL